MKKPNKKFKPKLNAIKGSITKKTKSLGKTPRTGWAITAKKMAENDDDKLLIPDFFEDENFDDWK